MNFIQAGKRWINLDNVTEVVEQEQTLTTMEGPTKMKVVLIRFTDGVSATMLTGDEIVSFMDFFERQAGRPEHVVVTVQQ